MLGKVDAMAVIDSILDEELARLLTLQERLSKEHEALPRGTLVVKSKNGHHYAYRAYREGRRVITDYVGPELSIQVQHLSAALMERWENFGGGKGPCSRHSQAAKNDQCRMKWRYSPRFSELLRAWGYFQIS